MIALAIVAFTVALTTGAVRVLPDAQWVYRCPRLGIATWYAVLATVPVAAGATVAELLLPWPGGPDALCAAGNWCVELTGERHGVLAWLLVRLTAAVTLLMGAVTGSRALAGAVAITRRRRRHREILRVASRRHGNRNVTVIEESQPAAYLLPGRPRHVVVTSGAVQRLHADELAAVLAHEQAHAAGRHQNLLDIAGLTARMFPRSSLAATAAAQVTRLVEMRADEVAALSQPRLHLARAIVAMAGGEAANPDGLAAATGGDALERLHRLMRPPRRLPFATSAAIMVAVSLLPTAPLALSATCRWWPILTSCLWDL